MATVDKEKKRRTILRANTTKVMNELKDSEGLTESQIRAKIGSLKKLQDELEVTNAKILDLMLDNDAGEDDLIKERDRCRLIDEEVRSMIENHEEGDALTTASSVRSIRREPSGSTSKSMYKLPRVTFEKYDLSPQNWNSFWGQFSKIHEDGSLSNGEKFQFLKMNLTGRSKQLVDNFTSTDENYPIAVDKLKERYGRKDLIVNAAYKELIELVRKQPNLTELYDTVSARISCLQSLGIKPEQLEMIIPLIVDCLPLDSRRIWERRQISANDDRMAILINFIGIEAEAEERIAASKEIKTPKRPSNTNYTIGTFAATTNERPEPTCIFCKNKHANKDCTKDMPVEERRQLVKKNRCCFACLAPGHSVNNCRTRDRLNCTKCKGKHREMCCDRSPKTAEGDKAPPTKPKPTKPPETTSSCFAGPTKNTTTVLQTLVATAGPRKVRILLDSGSHRSYASPAVCTEIGIRGGEETFTHILFGGQTSGRVTHAIYNINLRSVDGKNEFNFDALEQEKIVSSIPNRKFHDLYRKFLKEGITLADDDMERPIEILIGADVMAEFVIGVRSVDNLLAFETKLGWCAVGTLHDQSSTMNNVAISMLSLPNLWELEPLGIEKQTPTPSKKEDDQCIQEFMNTVRVEEGSYYVNLPWIAGHPPIPDRKLMAEARLDQVVQRLKRNNLYEAYDAVFKEWEADHIIEIVNDDEDVPSHYLPHRPVVREGKTTKIRPVFDASAKGPGEVSINDCLHAGPNMIANQLNILLQFRLKNVGVTADIRKAFLMIHLDREEDKNMLKFLWQRDGKTITFRHTRVVFGLTSSPFLLHATIDHLLQNSSGAFVDQLRKSFYVDDVVTSCKTMSEAQEFKLEATDNLAEANFDLRGWVFSGDDNEQHVLGLRWLPKEDVICIRKPVFKRSNAYTKKEILSLVGRVYDPLGLVSPPMLYLKLLLQECFKLKLTWNEPVPRNIQCAVDAWLTEIDLLDSILIPRCIGADDSTLTLHGFSDASNKGLGCCIFLRCESGADVSVSLVTSKARVCPTEPMTIPRLELVAALLTARLADNVKKAINVHDVTYWSDSTCTLYWIKRGEWRTFVGNRVKEINKLTNRDDWRFVDGERNPADLASRGCSLLELLNRRWWEGPSWLKGNESSWPIDKLIPTSEEAQTSAAMFFSVTDDDLDAHLFEGRGGFRRTVRIIGWAKRFLQNTRLKMQEREMGETLTFLEMEVAENSLVLWMQKVNPPELKANSVIFQDADGLLRIRTKLLTDNYESSFKEPIILTTCSLTTALLSECHERMHHAGPTIVLGTLREKYWIPKGRQLARKVINGCLRCRLHNSKPIQTPAVGLPNNRVEMGKAFEVCGCDLAGPLFLKNESKVWIVLFTCAVYRAVHLEVVDSLSTEAFIMALRRMVARRGRVREMYSDRGTNFTGAWNAIKAVEVETTLKIHWIFNVPHAPWWGGFFERLIGVMKSMLRRTIGRALLNLTELTTIVTEVEGLMNNRPITYHTDDPNELQPLTPLLFIQENSHVAVPELDAVDEENLTRRIRYVQEIRAHVKQRFLREYLSSLLLHSSKLSEPIREGELVWIVADEKRVNWNLGRVVECYPGKDGVVRAVKVKTQNGELLRPVQKLCKMEISCKVDVQENKDEEFHEEAVGADDDVESGSMVDHTDNHSLTDDLDNDDRVSIPTPSDPVPVRSRVGRLVKKPVVLDL